MARVAIPIIKAKPIILLMRSPMSAVVVPVAEARHLFQEKRYAAEALMTDQAAELMRLIHELRFGARGLTRRREGHEVFWGGWRASVGPRKTRKKRKEDARARALPRNRARAQRSDARIRAAWLRTGQFLNDRDKIVRQESSSRRIEFDVGH